MTTSSESIQLAPGHRCLLDLLQRKLLSTLESYSKLSLRIKQIKFRLANGQGFSQNSQLMQFNPEQQQHQQLAEQAAQFQEEEDVELMECELTRLKDKIRRISGRQKRYTMEIINGNGNNTIPKEEFFSALGLVTKEALIKLNSKSNQRRRRTTANPRFSHEAVQARKLLEPLQKRLERESRNMRDTTNKRDQSGRKSQRNQVQQQQQQNNSSSNKDSKLSTASNVKNNNVVHQNSTKNSRGQDNNNKRTNSRSSSSNNNNQQTPNGSSAVGKSSSVVGGNKRGSQPTSGRSQQQQSNTNQNGRNSRNRYVIQSEHRELLAQYKSMQEEIANKSSQIKTKRDSNDKLEKQNELIRKRGLDIISAMNLTNSNNPGYRVSTKTDENNVDEAPATSENGSEIVSSKTAATTNINTSAKDRRSENSPNDNESTSNDKSDCQSSQQSTASRSQNEAITLHQAGEQAGTALDFWINMQCDESLDGVD